jgi:hypothetical protein
VRDATSLGLPDAVRLSAQPAAAQQALLAALRAPVPTTTSSGQRTAEALE